MPGVGEDVGAAVGMVEDEGVDAEVTGAAEEEGDAEAEETTVVDETAIPEARRQKMQATSANAPSSPMVALMSAYAASVRRLRSRRQNLKERHCSGDEGEKRNVLHPEFDVKKNCVMYVATICILYLLLLSHDTQSIHPFIHYPHNQMYPVAIKIALLLLSICNLSLVTSKDLTVLQVLQTHPRASAQPPSSHPQHTASPPKSTSESQKQVHNENPPHQRPTSAQHPDT